MRMAKKILTPDLHEIAQFDKPNNISKIRNGKRSGKKVMSIWKMLKMIIKRTIKLIYRSTLVIVFEAKRVCVSTVSILSNNRAIFDPTKYRP